MPSMYPQHNTIAGHFQSNKGDLFILRSLAVVTIDHPLTAETDQRLPQIITYKKKPQIIRILTKFSSLAALEVVALTTSRAASDENFVKMTTFLFPWYINNFISG